MYEAEQFPTMSDREKYLFDLQGFIVVRGLLSTDEVKRLNEAVDANIDKHGEHTSRAVGPESGSRPGSAAGLHAFGRRQSPGPGLLRRCPRAR